MTKTLGYSIILLEACSNLVINLTMSFKCTCAWWKTSPYIYSTNKTSGPRLLFQITDSFTCTTIIYSTIYRQAHSRGWVRWLKPFTVLLRTHNPQLISSNCLDKGHLVSNLFSCIIVANLPLSSTLLLCSSLSLGHSDLNRFVSLPIVMLL